MGGLVALYGCNEGCAVRSQQVGSKCAADLLICDLLPAQLQAMAYRDKHCAFVDRTGVFKAKCAGQRSDLKSTILDE